MTNQLAGKTLGPLTRQAPADAGIDEPRLTGIENGTYEWTIGRRHRRRRYRQTRRSLDGSLSTKRYARTSRSTIYRTEAAQSERNPYNLLRSVTARLRGGGTQCAWPADRARQRRYEEAIVARGEAESALFAQGGADDWTTVAPASSWDAVAFEYRAAAEAVAATHTVETPAPTLPLLSTLPASPRTRAQGDHHGRRRAGRNGKPVNLPKMHPLVPLCGTARCRLCAQRGKRGGEEAGGDRRTRCNRGVRRDRRSRAWQRAIRLTWPTQLSRSASAAPANSGVTAFMRHVWPSLRLPGHRRSSGSTSACVREAEAHREALPHQCHKLHSHGIGRSPPTSV